MNGLAWRYWSCTTCREERFTVAWWAQKYACDHNPVYGSGTKIIKLAKNPLLDNPALIQDILERQ